LKYGIVLAGGSGRRFGHPKALTLLRGKPMIIHLIEKLAPLTDGLIVVVKEADPRLETILEEHGVQICLDRLPIQSPLVGLAAGFEHLRSGYAVAAPCDSPFLSPNTVKRLFEEAVGYDAAVPMWRNGYIEPLHSVYRVETCLEASRSTIEEGELSVRAMISRLKRVNYVEAEALGDPRHFLNLNTLEDLENLAGES